MNVGGEAQILTEGSVMIIPPKIRHSGKALTDCMLIDVFIRAGMIIGEITMGQSGFKIIDLPPENIADYGVCGYKDCKEHETESKSGGNR